MNSKDIHDESVVDSLHCLLLGLLGNAVRGVNSARVADSSVGEGAVVNCLGVVHMEEEVQDRAQVEVGREEQGVGETHGKEQGEEPVVHEVMRTNMFLSHDVSVHHSV